MANDLHTFFIMARVMNDIDLPDGTHLSKGYYRHKYSLDSSAEIEHPNQFSTDRANWIDCNLFSTSGEFDKIFDQLRPNLFFIEQMEYIETISYKDKYVPVFLDDYGQCFYCIFNNKIIGFGSFQDNYEDEIKELIDEISYSE